MAVRKSPPKKIQKKFRMCLPLEDWEEYATINYGLTIEDVLKLKKGEQIKVLMLHRNLWDRVYDSKHQCIIYDPKILFKDEWGVLVHDHDLTEEVFLQDFDLKEDWGKHIKNVDKLTRKDIEQYKKAYLKRQELYRRKGQPPPTYKPFEFDIEYLEGNWYPLTDGYLPPKDPQGFAKLNFKTKKHWKEFPKTTRVGWRGPMIKWDDLDKLPNIIIPLDEWTEVRYKK